MLYIKFSVKIVMHRRPNKKKIIYDIKRTHKKNIKLDPQKHSVISDHILELDHSIDWNNVKILDFKPYYYKRLISEMMHIKFKKDQKAKNGLN